MVRASSFFSEEERKRIQDAVHEAESTTSGEIVFVVATSSGDYDRAEDLVGVWVALIGLAALWCLYLPSAAAGSWAARTVQVSWVELIVALGVVVAGFSLGAILASRIAWLRRLFTSRRLMRLEVERAAARTFFEHGVRETKEGTGILVYLSLFERMVRVTGDRSIAEKLGDSEWQQVADLILEGLRQGRPGDGLLAGIRRCGQILGQHFPIQPGDVNELANDLRIID